MLLVLMMGLVFYIYKNVFYREIIIEYLSYF